MYAVFDVGGTNCRLGVSQTGEEIDKFEVWPTPMDFETGVRQLASKIEGKPVSGIAGSIAGVLDHGLRKLVKSPHLPGWENKPVAKKLEDLVGVKVLLENDAAAAALGEAGRGAGRRHEIVAYITISTGIGGARVQMGKIDRRLWGFEPGFQVISVDGRVGYFEDFASGTAMERVYGKKPWEIDDPAAWDNQARLLAIGLNNVTVMWSPEVIVLGGSVMKNVELPKVKEYLSEMLKIFPEIPEIKMAELGDKSGLYGALEMLRS